MLNVKLQNIVFIIYSFFILLSPYTIANSTTTGEWQAIPSPIATGSSRVLLSTEAGLYAGSSAGLYFSENNGKTWVICTEQSVIIESLIQTPDKKILIGTYRGGLIKFDPKTRNSKIVGLDSANYIFDLLRIDNTLFASSIMGGEKSGVYISKDNGDSWQLTGFSNKRVWSLSSPDNKQLFAGTQNGLFHSTNLGKTWEKLNKGFKESDVVSQVILVGENLLAGTGVLRSEGSGLYLFDQENQQWQPFGLGLPKRLTVNRLIIKGNQLLMAASGFDDKRQGIYTSNDFGHKWQTANFANKEATHLEITSNDQIFAATQGSGVWRSPNLHDWSPVGEGLRTWDIFALNQTENSDLLAASESGIWRYSAKTHKWQIPEMPLGASDIVLTKNGKILSTAENSVLVTDSNAISWKKAPLDGQYLSGLYIDDTRWYALDVKAAIRYSDNNGQSWQTIKHPELLGVRSIIKTSNGDLLASNRSGIYRSTNNGIDWNKEHEHYVWNFAKSSKGYIFASVTGRGMYRSADHGKSWQAINNGFGEKPIRSAWSILVTDKVIYLAGYINGFYQSTNNGDSWQAMEKGLSNPIALSVFKDKSGKIYGGTSAGIYLWKN